MARPTRGEVVIEAFRIAVPQSEVDDLHARLDRARLPNQVTGIGWEQGTERSYLAELLDHWRHRYDWRATEARVNAYDQIVTEIDGQRIHALHVRSPRPDALPILITHGWPGSVMEFLDVIDELATDFHLVLPSLPGFTFSGPTTEPGWHPGRIAEAFAELMHRLGYERYGLQGGDWGSTISTALAGRHPDRVVGLHLNMVTAGRPSPDAVVTPDEQAVIDHTREWRRTGSGYQQIQATKPQSLGYGLDDSPVGLAGWIVEKFHEWSDGDLPGAFPPDRLLDNLAAYWFTRTATSSLRIYWEMRRHADIAARARRIEVPTAIARFPGEIHYPPRSYVEAAFNVVRWSRPARGGHFAAMEAPAEYVADVRSFFTSLGPPG